jgi:5-formyltetrahydrofolate cyclo-ligase
MDENGSKRELRRIMKARRREVSVAARNAYSAALCELLLGRGDVRRAISEKGVFAVYLASSDEIDLSDLIECLWNEGCKVVVPAWRDGTYRLIGYSPSTRLLPGPMGILEPAAEGEGIVPTQENEVSVWIVPGLAFSPSGARLGYGGGWYDRFLAKADASAVALGVAYPFQMVESIPLERHDRPLTDIVCETTAVI